MVRQQKEGNQRKQNKKQQNKSDKTDKTRILRKGKTVKARFGQRGDRRTGCPCRKQPAKDAIRRKDLLDLLPKSLRIQMDASFPALLQLS